jgi:hypothetical protein
VFTRRPASVCAGTKPFEIVAPKSGFCGVGDIAAAEELLTPVRKKLAGVTCGDVFTFIDTGVGKATVVAEEVAAIFAELTRLGVSVCSDWTPARARGDSSRAEDRVATDAGAEAASSGELARRVLVVSC